MVLDLTDAVLLDEDFFGEDDADMRIWEKPRCTNSQVDKAGAVIAGLAQGDSESAFQVVNNWRASHGFPLNHTQMRVRDKACKVDNQAVIVQRIKRLYSITFKLKHEKHMRLSRMQDIGGCRAIVETVEQAEGLRRLFDESRSKQVRVNEKDYIAHPKTSGYRGIHQIYSYYSAKNPEYNTLRTEVQIRTQAQHAWATAVETVSALLGEGHALKSSQGDEHWLYFFKMMGSAIAAEENTALVPGVPANFAALKQDIKTYMRQLRVEDMLGSCNAAMKLAEIPEVKSLKPRFFIIELRLDEHEVILHPFREEDMLAANAAYLEVERKLPPNSQAVLVSAESIVELKRAYPNFYMDAKRFLQLVENVVS